MLSTKIVPQSPATFNIHIYPEEDIASASRLTLSQASLAGQTFRGGRETSGH